MSLDGKLSRCDLMSGMKTKNEGICSDALPKDSSLILSIYFDLYQLKNLYRQGWLRAGVGEGNCESVADHCFFVTLFSYLVANEYRPDLDVNKVIKYAMFHELGEAKVGDITKHDGEIVKHKAALEREAVLELFEKFPNGKEYFGYWEAYENQVDAEAVFVKKIDRLEMALQAKVYEVLGLGCDFTEWYESSMGQIKGSELEPLLSEVVNVPSDY